MSLLQNIARKRNWLIWFVCRDIHLGHWGDLNLSETTLKQQYRVNSEMAKLRLSINNDWMRQKKELEKKKASS